MPLLVLWLVVATTLKQFFPINTTTEAMNKFEETSYYQESHVVEKYLDKF